MERRPVNGRLVGLVVALGSVVIGLRPAAAQPAQPSRAFAEAYEAGKDAYNLGDYAAARASLSRAAELVPEAAGPYRYLAATAAAEQQWTTCLEHAVAYLQRAESDSPYLADLRALHNRCRTNLGRPLFTGDLSQSGAIAVTANVSGAMVKINGLTFGATPLSPRPISPGPATVEVRKDGYLANTREVVAMLGVVTDVEVRLDVDPAFAPAAPVAPVEETVVEDVGWLVFAANAPSFQLVVDGQPAELGDDGKWRAATGTYVVRIDARGFEPWTRRVRVRKGQSRTVSVTLVAANAKATAERRGWIALGVAGALTGVGVVFDAFESVAREEAQDIFDQETRRPVVGNSDAVPLQTRAEMDEAVDRAKRNALISGISYGLAAVSLGVSLYFLIEGRGEERRGAAPAWAVVPLADPAGGGAGAAAVYTMEVNW